MPPTKKDLSDPRSPWWGDHRSRYHFVAKLVRGRAVAEIGCGDGQGLSILDEAGARMTVGVDESILGVVRNNGDEVYGCEAETLRLPFRDRVFDVAVSFNQISQVDGQVAFLRELTRIIRDDGVLALSTWNSWFAPMLGDGTSSSHSQTGYGLRRLLEQEFSSVEIFGQTPRAAVSPYWQRHSGRSLDASTRRRMMTWKLQRRLPFQFRDALARLFHNHPFYPGEYDFLFDPQAVETAHALVALCRR